ncbi:hypothetical protein GCM10009801_68420 [Streptomyces albiaxialis]|uniref:Uncharacterized protein n=1 Tax=Streptomyces albiaxialis TaxID=329523 RepID=A0ABN2WS66_9ACTN
MSGKRRASHSSGKKPHGSERSQGSEQGKSALEETLDEFEEAETGSGDPAVPRRRHRPRGEAGDALRPSLGRQEDARGE